MSWLAMIVMGFLRYPLRCVFPALAVAVCLLPPEAVRADVEAGVRAFERGDYKAAIDEWRVDAAQGNANALFNLGQAYRLGKGVPRDIDQAQTYYQRASQAGHPAAMGNLATLYYFSKSPPRVEDAVYWWKMGAAAGDPRSQYILGAMTFNGDPVEKDLPRAYAWTWLAAQAGLEEAKTALATMRPYVPEAQRKAVEATARDLMTQTGRAYWQTQLPAPADPPAQDTAAEDAEAPPLPSPAPPPPAQATSEAAAGPAFRVNLASLASRAEAEAERRALLAQHGGMLADLPLRIAQTERDKRTYYRLQAGRFQTAAEAKAACDRLQTGGLDCFILHTDD